MAIDRNKVQKVAQRHIRKRSWDKALREYRTLVEDDPSDMRSLLKCGDLHVKLDQIDQALTAYKSVADSYAQQDMYEKAIAVYKQAQRLDDSDVALHCAIGECYFRLGRLKDANRSFHVAQKMYRAAGNHEAQREILEHMVRIDPEDVGLRIQLAERYTKDGFKDQALESFEFCAERLNEEGRLDELLQVLERTLYLSPERHDVRISVIRLYLDRQDNHTALKHLQIAFRELPEDVEVMELLAQTFERLGRTEKAVLVLQELGPLYEAQGRQSDAENLYRRLLRLDPTNTYALKATNSLHSDEVSGPVDTDSLSQRQNTPVPAEVEFLDDDIEFLDDDLVPETVPAAFEARSTFPPQPPSSPSRPSTTPSTNVTIHDIVDFDDLMDLNFDAFDILPDRSHATDNEAQDVQAIEPLEIIEELAEIEALEPIDSAHISEDEIRAMLSESDVFLRYGLLDKARAAIDNALSLVPKSLVAHEKLLALHRASNATDQEYRTLITLAELSANEPFRAHKFLSEALHVAPNPEAVYVRAEALDIDLYSPPPTDSLEELSLSVLEPIEPGHGPSTLLVDANDLLEEPAEEPLSFDDLEFLDPDNTGGIVLDDEKLTEQTDPFLDDPFSDAIEEFSSSIDDRDHDETLGVQGTSPEELGLDDIAVIDGSLNESTDPNLIDDLDSFDDLDLMDMDLEAGGLSEQDLAALEDVEVIQANDPDANSLFADMDADDLFGSLFSEVDHDGPVNLGSDDPMGELAEIDFFIQQELIEEASDALASFEKQNPNHPAIKQRRFQVKQIRHGVPANNNPFGSRSLSQKFNPNITPEEVTLPNFEEVVNSNLELGLAYRDMGLLDEAIEEFKQALDDPEAATTAQYNIALCEIDLGKHNDARSSLRQLLAMDGVSHEVLTSVREMLTEL